MSELATTAPPPPLRLIRRSRTHGIEVLSAPDGRKDENQALDIVQHLGRGDSGNREGRLAPLPRWGFDTFRGGRYGRLAPPLVTGRFEWMRTVFIQPARLLFNHVAAALPRPVPGRFIKMLVAHGSESRESLPLQVAQ